MVLSPQTLAKEITITDADLAAAYDQRKAEYVTPAKRSAEVVTVADEAKAGTLAQQWQAGADWDPIICAVEEAAANLLPSCPAGPSADAVERARALLRDAVTRPTATHVEIRTRPRGTDG